MVVTASRVYSEVMLGIGNVRIHLRIFILFVPTHNTHFMEEYATRKLAPLMTAQRNTAS